MITPYVQKAKSRYLKKKLLKEQVYKESDFWIIYCIKTREKYPYMYFHYEAQSYTKRSVRYLVKDKLEYLRNKKIKSRDDKYEILRLEKLPLDLEEVYMNFETYKSILHTHHQNIFKEIIETGKSYGLPNGCGQLFVIEKIRSPGTKFVNFNETNKNKNKLLAQGIPESELKNSKNPNGKYNYVVFLNNKKYYSFYWRKPSKESCSRFTLKIPTDSFGKRLLLKTSREKAPHELAKYRHRPKR